MYVPAQFYHWEYFTWVSNLILVLHMLVIKAYCLVSVSKWHSSSSNFGRWWSNKYYHECIGMVSLAAFLRVWDKMKGQISHKKSLRDIFHLWQLKAHQTRFWREMALTSAETSVKITDWFSYRLSIRFNPAGCCGVQGREPIGAKEQ